MTVTLFIYTSDKWETLSREMPLMTLCCLNEEHHKTTGWELLDFAIPTNQKSDSALPLVKRTYGCQVSVHAI